jgi:peptide deformylase
MERAKRPLIGLAAPQIGERAQIILVPKEERDSDDTYGKFMAVFNPSVSVRKADKIVPHGCFSANEIFVRLLSATDATLMGFNRHGEQLRIRRTGINATVDEHEMRHLKGLRAADIAMRDNIQLDWRPPEQAAEYRKYADGHRDSRSWPDWSETYPYAQWQAVKTGKFLIERYK